MAGRAGVTILHQHRLADRDDRDANFPATLCQCDLTAARSRCRCVILSVGSDGEPLLCSEDAHQIFGLVIVGGKIAIADRPVFTGAILHRFWLEIPFGHAQ